MAVRRGVLSGSDPIKPMHQVGKEGGSEQSNDDTEEIRMPNAAADTRSLDLSIDCLISETSMNDFHYNLVDG